MTQPTKSSAGALRAARSILANAYGLSLDVCAHIIDRETGVSEEIAEWARPALDAGLSSTSCRGCKSPNEPNGELKGGYGRGYWLLSSKGINHPWHASCASRALGEFEARETGMGELLEAARYVAKTLRGLGPRYHFLSGQLEQAIAKCDGKGSE